MPKIPRDQSFDATYPILFKDGYRYIGTRCEKYQSDIFKTRLMLRRAICIRGEDAAKLFYDNALFMRKGAAPKRIQRSLLGKGGVHGLDDEAHRHRKQMFLSLMHPENLARLSRLADASWEIQSAKWEKMRRVVLQKEAQEILCRAVCEWSGIPLGKDLPKRARDLAAMVDSFGAVGPRFWRGTRARRKTEKWIRGIVGEIRKGKLTPSEESAAAVIAMHRDLSGKLLDQQIAAVELINVIRPTVAVAYLIVFSALALHQHSEYLRKLREGGDRECEMFVQEVRRFYPFAPVMGAIARRDLEWRGYKIPKGTLAILDLYGTNHDGRIWNQPDEFRPERFENWNGSPFNFIPQGGGDHSSGHRCAGEWITIEQLKTAVGFLIKHISYEVPQQDLRVSMTRMPTRPRSGFVMRRVRKVSDPAS
jgi:fatty-acid peroxygenase